MFDYFCCFYFSQNSIFAFFLFLKGANVNAAKLHETALHYAAKTKNADLIELLIEFGGKVYARDNLNKKPIHYTSLGSPSYLRLEFYESKCAPFHSHHKDEQNVTPILFFSTDTPLSLQQICRLTLRGTLGKRACEVVSMLDLPNRIIDFLSYMPPQIIEI